MTMDDERVREYVAGLPDASGTFAGTYSPDVDVTALLGPVSDLLPIEVDTGDLANPAAGPLTSFAITISDRTFVFPVDHVDLLGGNRARVWVRRPQPHGAE